MEENIYFALPGVYDHFNIYKKLISYMEKFPNKFYENVKIGCLYGNFSLCSWDGGRNFNTIKPVSIEQIKDIADFLESKKIPLRLIYTNPTITKEDTLDHVCNLITTICENPNNEIVVNSSILEEYLRKEYPSYSFISSTTKCNNFNNSIEELPYYKYVCLDYNLNHRFDLFKKIPRDYIDRIEILVNAICPPGCPCRKEHYRLVGLSNKHLEQNYHISCSIKDSTVSYDTMNYRNTVSPQEIIEVYKPLGFFYFKLEGRSLDGTELILNLARYLIKPEYQFEVIQYLLQGVEK